MATDHSEPVDILTQLVSIHDDAQKGYHTAVENLTRADYALKLREAAQTHQQLANQLRQLLAEQYQTDALAVGSAMGSVHRLWMEMRHALSRDDTAVIDECQRGETFTLKAYQEALIFSFPPEVIALLRQHYAQIEKTYDAICILSTAARETGRQTNDE